jgi:hypothetical protein
MPGTWLVAARGVDVRRLGMVALLVLAPVVASHIAIALRTPGDRGVYGRVIAHGVLVGLVLPVAALGVFLEDRACWLQPGSVRRLGVLRAVWFTCLTLVAVLMGLVVSWLLHDRVAERLLFADTLLLWGLCGLSSVFVGGRHSWVVPAAAALVCSVPGLVPLRHNVLSLDVHAGLVLRLAVVLIVAGGVLFGWLDEWRIGGGLQRNLTMGDVADG